MAGDTNTSPNASTSQLNRSPHGVEPETTTNHHHQPQTVKNYTVRFPNWGRTVEVWARYDSDAIESARIVLELPSRALWDGRIANVEEVIK